MDKRAAYRKLLAFLNDDEDGTQTVTPVLLKRGSNKLTFRKAQDGNLHTMVTVKLPKGAKSYFIEGSHRWGWWPCVEWNGVMVYYDKEECYWSKANRNTLGVI